MIIIKTVLLSQLSLSNLYTHNPLYNLIECYSAQVPDLSRNFFGGFIAGYYSINYIQWFNTTALVPQH